MLSDSHCKSTQKSRANQKTAGALATAKRYSNHAWSTESVFLASNHKLINITWRIEYSFALNHIAAVKRGLSETFDGLKLSPVGAAILEEYCGVF